MSVREGRAAVAPWGGLRGGLALLATSACLNLTPIHTVHRVELAPLAVATGYQVDPVDGSVEYVKEGLRLKVRHLRSEELDREIPGEENPFIHRELDYDLAYVPQRFTVFQISVNNPTYDKVLVQPERSFLVTDRGRLMRPYQLTRADALGDPKNFETYWLSRGVQSGNAQKLYLERMGALRGSVYHRDSFVFKGDSYTGKLAFDPLPLGTREVTLHIDRFVLEFGIYDIPKTQLDLEFRFSVLSDVVEPESEGMTASGM